MVLKPVCDICGAPKWALMQIVINERIADQIDWRKLEIDVPQPRRFGRRTVILLDCCSKECVKKVADSII